MLREYFLVVTLFHSRIALLHSAEETLFRRDQGALPVDINRAAFEHNAVLAERWPEFPGAGRLSHQAANFFILLPVGIFCPSIKAPLDGRELICSWGLLGLPHPCRVCCDR